MNSFIMMVGLPASGKSYKAAEITVFLDYFIHSSDSLRKEMFGNENDQNNNQELFNELHRRIIIDLLEGRNVIYDATNINYKRRMEFLESIKHINCTKTCIVMATSYETCLANNAKRERSIPEDVIKRMYTNFYVPQYYEGWDNIDIIYSGDEYRNFNLISTFSILNKVEQKNPHHTLTIGKHCIKCHDLMIKDGVNNPALLDAAFIHDIGKLFTKEWNEEKQRCTYYQHHLVGAYDSLLVGKNYTNDIDYILEVANYIQWHMMTFLYDDKSTKKIIDIIGKVCYNSIMKLHECDIKAK